MGNSIGRGALNRYRRYMNVSTTTFSHFGEVLSIPSYVGLNIKSIQYGKGFLIPLGRGKIALIG